MHYPPKRYATQQGCPTGAAPYFPARFEIWPNAAALAVTVARLPRARLEPLVADLDSALLQPIRANVGALPLLPAYIGAIDEATSASPEVRKLVVSQVYDFFALALGVHRAAREIAEGRGVGATRLQAIREEIVARLVDPSPSTATVAQRHGRYVGILSEDSGTSYSSYVLEQRLEQARRLLADPRQAHLTIGAIASACGFADIPYFNRSFRRAFGATPSDIRALIRPTGANGVDTSQVPLPR